MSRTIGRCTVVCCAIGCRTVMSRTIGRCTVVCCTIGCRTVMSRTIGRRTVGCCTTICCTIRRWTVGCYHCGVVHRAVMCRTIGRRTVGCCSIISSTIGRCTVGRRHGSVARRTVVCHTIRRRSIVHRTIICRTGCQLLAYGQRLCLESIERVVAATWSRIHCEYHPLAAVAGRSICSLATMDPDGFCLVREQLERTVSSIMRWEIVQGNAYIINNEIPDWEQRRPQCNRDTIRCEDIRKHAMSQYLDRQGAQASVHSAIKRRAWCVKAGLGHTVVLAMENERDALSHLGGLEGRLVSTTRILQLYGCLTI